MNILARFRHWRAARALERARRAAQKVRHIPDSYFVGYRRLARTRSDIQGEHCWNCRHAIAHVSWWCDIGASYKWAGCKWEPCYVEDELTEADLKAGGSKNCLMGRWLGLPTDTDFQKNIRS